jgi:integrase
LIPFFGNYSITNITHTLVQEFGVWRDAKMAADKRRVTKDEKKTLKPPTHSTILNHNAALNQVFDEAMNRGFLTASQRPVLENKGKPSERRPAFELIEVRGMLNYFDDWIELGRDDKSKELRHLMRDYVEVLLDTGARPGKELMDLKWKQVKYAMKPTYERTGKYYEVTPEDTQDEPPTEIIKADFNRSCEMVVSGKTGERTMLGMNPTVKAFARIIHRNYGIRNNHVEPFAGIAVASNDDFVFRTKDKAKPTSFQNLFTQFLTEHDLLIDPKTEKERVFYSLRHTYATLALTYDEVSIHTLSKQMGTSVGMIEKHYSHLEAVKAIEQLRGYETRRLMKLGSVLEHKFVPKAVADTKKSAE